jgi:DNA-binding NarL/FixJ family response regulator
MANNHTNMKYKVVIFEDNFLMQESLKALLEMNDDITVCGVYDNAKDMLRIYEQSQPDLIISDIDMPEVNGLEGLKQVKNKYPEAKVMIFTVFEENDKVLNAICLGANGYVLKSSTAEKITESIFDVINGGSPLTPSIASKILQHFPKHAFSSNNEMESLTTKEKEVLEWLVKGYSYKMIAAELDKSLETIRTQIKKIYKKLNVQSNAEAIIKALNK